MNNASAQWSFVVMLVIAAIIFLIFAFPLAPVRHGHRLESGAIQYHSHTGGGQDHSLPAYPVYPPPTPTPTVAGA